ncbi:MAG: alpha-ketoacid dehydrogenase subunit beta [Propionibacteriales bacterium]|nr:alpha-ketoacid dehydrogenase subunit beta [Propionibacteriales bacterium]
MPELKYWQAIRSALRDEMARDERVLVLGEDVAQPGGPFGATKGLLDEFGPSRVRDTPISEAAIMGAALGAAMTGLRPVAEIMFLDFMTLAADQLVNQAAKVSWMSGGRFHVPLVVRTICGNRRGTGPQHAQSLEAWLAHVPGLKVVWPSSPGDAYGLLKTAIRDDDPVVVVESLALWGSRGPVDEGADVPLGTAAVRQPGGDLTVAAWGATVPVALDAARHLADEGIGVEVVDVRSISPLDEATILASVAKTGRLVVVHDAVSPAGVGAEIAALAAGQGFDTLRAPVVRVTAPFAPVPFAKHLETAYYPQADDVVAAARRVLER